MAVKRSRSVDETAAIDMGRTHDRRRGGDRSTHRGRPNDAPSSRASRRPGVVPLLTFRSDPRNANLGTARGREVLERSLRDYGAGRSALADATGTLLAGNKAFATAQALKLPIKIVETDGG